MVSKLLSQLSKFESLTQFFRWDLIAGRIPGRKPEEIERFWIMRNRQGYAERGKEASQKKQ